MNICRNVENVRRVYAVKSKRAKKDKVEWHIGVIALAHGKSVTVLAATQENQVTLSVPTGEWVAGRVFRSASLVYLGKSCTCARARGLALIQTKAKSGARAPVTIHFGREGVAADERHTFVAKTNYKIKMR